MKIKTFYASTMAEALRSVKEEFGSDGLILSTKEVPLRSSWFRSKPAVEVVAAIDTERESDKDLFISSGQNTAPAGAARQQTGFQVQWPKVDKEYSEMRRALYSLARPAVPSSSSSLFSDAAAYELYQDLVTNEVDEWLAYKLLDEAQMHMAPEERGNRDTLAKAVTGVARGLIRSEGADHGLPAKKVVAFVGPTGVGKTTAAAKLAARLALEMKKKVVLLTTDTYRIGAVEQLKTYAGLMGLPFRVVAQAGELGQVIHENCQRDYILIDTAGRSQRDLGAVQDLMQALQESTEIECHLVMSATTKPLDMREIVDRFGVCNPDHLLFTKLDETSTFGPIFNELVRTQKPLSYIADGQRVPEDLHAVRGDQIVDIVLNAH
jgi:flagellar biosynthesis protein FlhF